MREYDPQVKITHTGAGSRKRNLNKRKNNCKTVSEKCGYILWKDRKVVVFYTDDLLLTPDKDFLHSTDENDNKDGAKFFGGFAPVLRWDTAQNLNRRTFLSPALVWLYNMFMNKVDVMDHELAVNVTSRKEEKVSTLVYTHVLDLVVNDANSIDLWCIKKKIIIIINTLCLKKIKQNRFPFIYCEFSYGR